MKELTGRIFNIQKCSIRDGRGMRTTVFLKNIADFGKMNEVYKGFFSEGNYPARSAFQVAALPQDALVEIEVVALKD